MDVVEFVRVANNNLVKDVAVVATPYSPSQVLLPIARAAAILAEVRFLRGA
jgi:hypothetical protein